MLVKNVIGVEEVSFSEESVVGILAVLNSWILTLEKEEEDNQLSKDLFQVRNVFLSLYVSFHRQKIEFDSLKKRFESVNWRIE